MQKCFTAIGAAKLFQQHDLTAEKLNAEVLSALGQGYSHTNPSEQLQEMAQKAGSLAVPDSAERLAHLVRHWLEAG